MRAIGTAEIIFAIGASVFAFVVATSHRTHKTRAALVASIVVSLLLLAWDRYLYVSTSRGLLDTLTCSFTPSALPCRDASSPNSGKAEPQPEPAIAVQNVMIPSDEMTPLAPGQAPERIVALDDSNARSIWTTSVYSYAPGGGGPGGGLADSRLRVGGWGDTYVSLITIPLEERRVVVHRATLSLHLNREDRGRAATPMQLMRITRQWSWSLGDRLWWRDVPSAEFVAVLPAPSSAASVYEIDVTDLYNRWVRNETPNFGIMLRPVLTNNNFTTFYSTRADPGRRPSLRIIY